MYTPWRGEGASGDEIETIADDPNIYPTCASEERVESSLPKISSWNTV